MKFLKFVQSIKRLLGATTEEIVMAKADVVATGLSAIQSGVTQVYSDQLGLAYDGGFTDGVASVPVGTGGGFQQSDIDAAVAAAQAVDAQALSDAKAVSDAALADLQSKLDTLAAKEGQEAGVIAGLQGSLQAIKDAEAALQSLFPVPAPVPTPDPVPAA